MLKRCEICGKEFDAVGSRKTCSEECKIELKVKTLKRQWEKKKEKSRTGKPVGRPRKAHKEHTYIPTKNDTLCWSCQNATGKCSWSARLEPVVGWDAEKIKVKGDFYMGKIIDSYIVKSCPKYIKDS